MDVVEVGKIAVCCRIRPPETIDSSTTSSSTDAKQSREGRSRSRGSTPIETDDRHVRLKPEYAALAEHNTIHGGGIAGSAAAAVAAGRLSTGARGGRRRGSWGFTFDDVMEEGCRQDEVYRRCAKCIVDSALVGLNGTVMACELSLSSLLRVSTRYLVPRRSNELVVVFDARRAEFLSVLHVRNVTT